MCQLTFVSLKVQNDDISLRLFRNLILVQSMINSVENPDGFGFFTPNGGAWKTKLPANGINNLGRVLKRGIKNPIGFFHVRKATYTNNKKTIDDSKSHPFETDKLVLAHNGSLEPKILIYNEAHENKIDTEIFTDELDFNYKDDLGTAIKETVDGFYGKFAFMIYDKIKEDFWIARGETATLWKAKFTDLRNGQDLGFIVNTNKLDLEKGFLVYNNLFQLNNVEMLLSEAEEIPKNSVLKLNKETGDFEKICDVEETHVPVVTKPAPASVNNKAWNSKQESFPADKAEKIAIELISIMDKYALDIYEIDSILKISGGTSILELTPEDFDFLKSFVVPIFHQYWNSHKGREWRTICNKILVDRTELYGLFDLKFPYMLNSIEKLREIKNKLPKNSYITRAELKEFLQ